MVRYGEIWGDMGRYGVAAPLAGHLLEVRVGVTVRVGVRVRVGFGARDKIRARVGATVRVSSAGHLLEVLGDACERVWHPG